MAAVGTADSTRATGAAAAAAALRAARGEGVGLVRKPPTSAVLPDQPVINLTWGDRILGPFERYQISLPRLITTTVLPLIAGVVLLKKFANVHPLVGRVLVGFAILASVVFIGGTFLHRMEIRGFVAKKMKEANGQLSDKDQQHYQMACELYTAIKDNRVHAFRSLLAKVQTGEANSIFDKQVPDSMSNNRGGNTVRSLALRNPLYQQAILAFMSPVTRPNDEGAE